MEKVLRKKYADKKSCQFAVASNAGELLSDAFDARGSEGVFNTISGTALMKCIGWNNRVIIAYYLGLLGVFVACAVAVPFTVPLSFFKNCQICTRSRNNYFVGRSRRMQSSQKECIEYRTGTDEECEKQGKIIKHVIGVVLGLACTAFIQAVMIFYLKLKIYKVEAVVGEGILKAAL